MCYLSEYYELLWHLIARYLSEGRDEEDDERGIELKEIATVSTVTAVVPVESFPVESPSLEVSEYGDSLDTSLDDWEKWSEYDIELGAKEFGVNVGVNVARSNDV